jgi:hypothetical protein
LGDSTLWSFDDSIFVVRNNDSWEDATVVHLQSTVALKWQKPQKVALHEKDQARHFKVVHL